MGSFCFLFLWIWIGELCQIRDRFSWTLLWDGYVMRDGKHIMINCGFVRGARNSSNNTRPLFLMACMRPATLKFLLLELIEINFCRTYFHIFITYKLAYI